MLAEVTFTLDGGSILASLALCITALGGLITTLRSNSRTRQEVQNARKDVQTVSTAMQGNGRGTLVHMVEQLMEGNQQLAEDNKLTRAHLARIDTRLGRVEQRIDRGDERFDLIARRLESHDVRIYEAQATAQAARTAVAALTKS